MKTDSSDIKFSSEVRAFLKYCFFTCSCIELFGSNASILKRHEKAIMMIRKIILKQ